MITITINNDAAGTGQKKQISILECQEKVKNMKAVILTAGEGKRIRPLTNNMTKGMISIGNKPILEYILEALKGVGITDIVMVVGYKKEKILSHFDEGRNWGVKITYVEQAKQRGTANALMCAEHLLKEDFILLPGDNYIEESTLKPLVDEGMSPYRVMVAESNIPSKYGIVALEGGNIKSISISPGMSERSPFQNTHLFPRHLHASIKYKGSSKTIFTCLCRFKPEIFHFFEGIKGKDKNNITGLIEHMLGLGITIKTIKTGVWRDAVYPWDLLTLNNIALGARGPENKGDVEGNVTIRGNVSIGKGSVIRGGTYIQGPVAIGEGCEIGPNVSIFPTTAIGNNVSVDAFTKISNSIVMSDVSIATGCLLENSVLGEGVKYGANASNRTLDVEVGEIEKMGSKSAIGCIVGEDSVVGHGTVIDGGKVIGAGCYIDALVHVNKDVIDGIKMVR